MSRKHSRVATIVQGGFIGGVVGFLLSLWVSGSTQFGDRITEFFGYLGFYAGFFLLFAFIPASTIVGAITGSLIVGLLCRTGARDDDN